MLIAGQFVNPANAQICEVLELHKIKAQPVEDEGQFGRSISIWGDYALIGEPEPDCGDVGSAYIFHFDGTNWVQEQKLTVPSGPDNNAAHFGISVALWENIAVIGGPHGGCASVPGSVFVFEKTETGWIQKAKLVPPDSANGDLFGRAVAIHKNVIVAGRGLGDANIFRFNGTAWVHETKVLGGGDVNGVGVWDDFAVIVNDVSSIGTAKILKYQSGNWITNATFPVVEGASVSIRDNQVVVGCKGGVASSLGIVKVFNHNGSTWSETTTLTASDAAGGDEFGSAVAQFADSLSGPRKMSW